jgi:hypothetical protein
MAWRSSMKLERGVWCEKGAVTKKVVFSSTNIASRKRALTLYNGRFLPIFCKDYITRISRLYSNHAVKSGYDRKIYRHTHKSEVYATRGRTSQSDWRSIRQRKQVAECARVAKPFLCQSGTNGVSAGEYSQSVYGQATVASILTQRNAYRNPRPPETTGDTTKAG